MIYYFDNFFVLGSLLFIYIICCICLKFLFKKNSIYLLFFTVMYIYICNVIKITQFPMYAFEDMKMAGQNVWREMNLIPFKEILGNFSSEVLLNVLLTMPLGFGLPFLTRCSWKKITIIGIGAGILLELGQLLSALWIGFTFRHVNIDDTILNFIGTLLGYAFFKGFKCVFKACINKLELKMNKFLTYINYVCDEEGNKDL